MYKLLNMADFCSNEELEKDMQYLSKKYGLGSKSQLHKWVKNYKAFGNDGLLRSRENEVYSFEMKLSIVELYLTSEITYQELAIQNGIKNPATIGNWVNRFTITLLRF